MLKLCAHVGRCRLPAGHVGICLYGPDHGQTLATLEGLEQQLADTQQGLARALEVLDIESVRRRAAEAALQAFVEGKYFIVTPTAVH